MKQTHYLRHTAFALLLAGASIAGITACGDGKHTSTTDSTKNVEGVVTDTANLGRDTAPAAEIPPGAINPGEDSSRYGTGTADSSKNRTRRP